MRDSIVLQRVLLDGLRLQILQILFRDENSEFILLIFYIIFINELTTQYGMRYTTIELVTEQRGVFPLAVHVFTI